MAGRVGDPEYVANAVPFLVSQKASYIYVWILSVDGVTWLIDDCETI